MCGISGILNFTGDKVKQADIRRMTDSIAHRGPDSEGCWIDECVGLGHRRLSIIDLSDNARQPMHNSAGSTVISYNGEIYNYQELARGLRSRGYELKTHSDTEVILGLYDLYGEKCLEYLRGMFAFAIWDKGRRQLFLARDRVGIKPLYYMHTQQCFVFGSEIKSIAVTGCSGLAVDNSALCGYLRFLVVPQPETIFRDIKKLCPGQYMLVGADGKTITRTYWSIDNYIKNDAEQDENTCVDKLNSLLNESVHYHMVADVPVSAFLSGGLDSSAVVSLMRENAPGQDIATFSTVFPGMPDFDEDRYARQVAEAKATDHHANRFDEDFLNDYEKIAWHLDEPFAITSAYATYYLSRSAAKDTKVVLTGDGGDELFAGYEGYKNNSYMSGGGAVGVAMQVASSFMLSIDKLLGGKSSLLNKMFNGFYRRSGSEGLRYSEQVSQNSYYAASQVINREFLAFCLESWRENLVAYYYDNAVTTDLLQKKLYAGFRTRLTDEMLMKVDRMTMAHSLEARVPLLDHGVAEYAFQLPASMKLAGSGSGQTTKYILKKVMEKYLPTEIIYRKKQGFNIPVRDWLEGEFTSRLLERMNGGMLIQHGIIQPGGVERLLQMERHGKHNFRSMLMLLLALETWLSVYSSRVGKVSFN